MASYPYQQCLSCGATFSANETTGGQVLRCPSCGALEGARDTLRDTSQCAPPPRPAMPQPSGQDSGNQDPAATNTVDYRPSEDATDRLGVASGRRPTPAQQQVGRFRVLSVLGHGAFGNVYRAFDPLLDREVALKVPRFVEDDPALRERFLREAKAAARLRHPNIVAIYESGQTADHPYIASEYVDGVPLSQVMRDRKLDTRTAVDWVRQIAEALHYAHGEGIVHRDIKPANIMVNHAGRPQVMDFGLAKRTTDESAKLSIEGQIIGTPAYMAPEQAKGKMAEVGPNSDQYSVGVVLYELLCGRTPYTGDSWSVVSQLTSESSAPAPPRTIRADVPRDLEACCLKALEKEPAARYRSLQGFADDLQHWLEGRPLNARPIGVGERLVRWCRKNRLIASLAGALAALVVVIAIVGYLLAFRFEQLATTATNEATEAKKAREQEKDARLATEQLLIDTYTETGLTAARNGDAREAILWFANAAARAEKHPLREKHNRMRLQSWLAEIAIPVYVFEPKGQWCETFAYHPSGRWLLSVTNAPACEIRDLRDGSLTPLPVQETIQNAAWRPDGKAIAVAMQQRVAIFEFPGGREIDAWTHDEPIAALTFNRDSKLLAVGGAKTARVRDLEGKSFATPSLEHGNRVTAVVFSEDARYLATNCADRKVRVFAVAPAVAQPVLPPQPSANMGKDVPPTFVGADRVVIADSDRTLCCWDLVAKEIVWERDWKRSLCMALSPKGDVLAVGDQFEVALLDPATGIEVGQRILHRNQIADVSFHPDGKLLLSGSLDQTARISHVPSGEPLIGVIPHHDTANRCVWSPDGATFATVHWANLLTRVWKLGRAATKDHALPLASRRPFVKISQDTQHILPCGIDSVRDSNDLQVFDAARGTAVDKAIKAPGPISDAAFVPGTSLVVIGGAAAPHDEIDLHKQNLDQAGVVRFVNFHTGATALPDVATPSEPVAVQCSADGRTIVVLCHRGHVLVLDAATGTLRKQHQAFGGAAARHGFVIRDRIRFGPADDRFAVWGSEGLVEVRDGSSGDLLFGVAHQGNFVHDVRFAPDGNTLATCSSDMTVKVWNARAEAPALQNLPHSGWVFTAQFSRDGKRLLTASSDRQARIWDLAAGTASLTTLAQSDEVQGACFAADEGLFLIGTRDGSISVWDANLGRMLAPMRRVKDMVYQLALTDNGTRLVAAGRLHPQRMFDLADWLCPADEHLPRDHVRRLGEILSAQRIHEGGAATSLSKEEWLERWRAFHAANPDHPALRMPASP